MKQDRLSKLKWFVSSTRAKMFALMIVMIALIIYFQFGVNSVYEWAGRSQRAEIQTLSGQLQQTRRQLVDYENAAPSVNETDLETAKAYLSSQRTPIPSGLDINHVIRDVLLIGDQCGIQAIPLSTSDPSRLNVGGFGMLRWDFTLVTEGRFEDIAAFIGRIDGNDISGTIVEAVSIYPVLSAGAAADNITTDNSTGFAENDSSLAKGNITVSVFCWDSGEGNVAQQ